MLLTIGIVELPSVGKSALFNAPTHATALAVNYPFTTIESNIGVALLPDARLDKLAELFHSAKVIPVTVSPVDIAGVVRGTSQGKGLGNQPLANIHETNATCPITRASADPDVAHAEGRVDPRDDIETVTAEPVLADTQTLEKQIPHLTKEVTNKKTPKEVLETAEAALEPLEQGRVFSAHGTGPDSAILRGFGLMTTKKPIYVFNTDGADLAGGVMQAELRDFVAPTEAIFLDAEFETEFVELEPEEVREMLEASGQDEVGFDELVQVGFGAPGLQIYLTAGEKEVRAWMIHKGRTTSQAAGVIHTDSERGLIGAEAVSYDGLVKHGSLTEACTHSRVYMKGKDYVMADGGIVGFRTGLTSKK